MDEQTQHKKALSGPHVRLVAGIGVIVLITALFLYIYAKDKQNQAGSDTSAGSLGSGQSGSAWDSLTYNLNYTPASSGSTNNPGAPGTPATSPAIPTAPSAPSAPKPTSGTPKPTSGGGKVKKPVKHPTPPVHHTPAHPAHTGAVVHKTVHRTTTAPAVKLPHRHAGPNIFSR